MRNSEIIFSLLVVASLGFSSGCESKSPTESDDEDAFVNDENEAVDGAVGVSENARDAGGATKENKIDGATEGNDSDGSIEDGGEVGDAVVRCEGPECCWTDCISGEQTCGEFEPLEACSNVEVPAWFEQHSCVVDYDSLQPFTEDARQGIGYCACLQADQVGTAEIPIEEVADGCIYTYGGNPCGEIDISACFPETDAGIGSRDAGSTGSTSECSSDSSCGYRQVCRDRRCVSVQCTSDSHCGSCSRCSSNVCRSCGYGPYGCYC